MQTKFSKQNISVWEVTIVELVTEFFHLITSEVSFKVFFLKMGQKEDPKLFDRQKLSVLDSSDLSRKGNVDKDIRDFLDKLNSHKNYFSLSSCSGRIIILRQQTQNKVIILSC